MTAPEMEPLESSRALRLFPEAFQLAPSETAASQHPINPEKLFIPGTLLGPISRELRAWSALNQHLPESKTPMTMFTGVWRKRAWVLEPDKTKFEPYATRQQSGIMRQFTELLLATFSSFAKCRYYLFTEVDETWTRHLKKKTYVRFNTA